MVERLVAAALIRNGIVESRGFRSHYEIRAALGDAHPATQNLNDEEGFLTNSGRFVDRDEAIVVGLDAGQLPPMWKRGGRRLLSSDINWDDAS